MNFFKKNWNQIVVGVISSVILSVVLWIYSKLSSASVPWLLIILVFILAFIVSFAVYHGWIRYILGINGWKRKRKKSADFSRCLDVARSRLDFLLSFGGSLKEIETNWKVKFEGLAKSGVQIRVLLLNPNSKSVHMRITKLKINDTADPTSIFGIINEILKINNTLRQENIRNPIEIGVYDRPATWSMVFVDNIRASIGFYSGGYRSIENPSISVVNRLTKNENQTLFNAYYDEYQDIWESSRKISSDRDYHALSEEKTKRGSRGIVFVITGPSGSGKTTYCKYLLEKYPVEFNKSITYTTRPNRKNEEDGEQYHFVSDSDFKLKHESGHFFCTSSFCENYYGVQKKDIDNSILDKKDLLLDSIMNIPDLRNYGTNIVIIYLTTNTNGEMYERICTRLDNISQHELELRARNNVIQSKNVGLCDYVIDTSNTRSIADVAEEIYNIIVKVRKTYVDHDDVLPYDLYEFSALRYTKDDLLPKDVWDVAALKRLRESKRS